MNTDDITYEQNLRIQRALLKEKRKVDANKVVLVALATVAIALIL